MAHKWGNWRYLELNSRIRKGIQNPRRERLAVRKALEKLGLRYKEIIPVLNPHYKGWKGHEKAAMQWLDFCVWTGSKMIVLLFDPRLPGHGIKPHEKEAWIAKKQLLTEKGIPFLVLSRKEVSQVYEVQIRNFLRKEAQQ